MFLFFSERSSFITYERLFLKGMVVIFAKSNFRSRYASETRIVELGSSRNSI